MSLVSRAALIVLGVAVVLYAALKPFMNPAPYVLELICAGVLVAAAVEGFLAYQHRAIRPPAQRQ